MDGSTFNRIYAVVLRFAGLHPSNLSRLEMHARRAGGDLEHCDPIKMEKQKTARPLIGADNWVADTLETIQGMRGDNFTDELAGLIQRKRHADIRRRLSEGQHDPWRPSKHGPMRELILTVNKDWFNADPAAVFDEGDENNQRIQDFERLGLDWLRHEFGDDVVYARADHDEAAYHIHAVILPRVEIEMTRTDKKTGEKRVIATRRMLQPSKFEIIKDYEKAQDSVGEWFAPLGLVRGERRKDEFRRAMKAGEAPPPKRHHVHTALWRRQEEIRLAREATLLQKQQAKVAVKEQEADEIIHYADQVARGEIEIEDEPAESDDLKRPTGQPAPVPSMGFVRARKAFQAALTRLRKREQKKAEAAAEAKVFDAIQDIKAADQVILNIAAMLPAGLREKIAIARKSLTAKIMGLDRRKSGQKTSEIPSGKPRTEREQ